MKEWGTSKKQTHRTEERKRSSTAQPRRWVMHSPGRRWAACDGTIRETSPKKVAEASIEGTRKSVQRRD